MAKNKQMIKITVTGFIEAPDILDFESFNRQHALIGKIEKFAEDNLLMHDVKKKPQNKLIEEPEEAAKKTEDAPASTDETTDWHGAAKAVTDEMLNVGTGEGKDALTPEAMGSTTQSAEE